jgi:pilus assembly protein CpaF
MAILERLEASRRGDGARTEERSSLRALAKHYRRRLMEEGDLGALLQLPRPILRARLEAMLAQMIREEGEVLSPTLQSEIVNLILDETVGLGPLEPLLRDPPDHGDHGELEGPAGRGGTGRGVRGALRPSGAPGRTWSSRTASTCSTSSTGSSPPWGGGLDESNPGWTPGWRTAAGVAAAIPPIAVDGPVLSIRRFRERAFTMEDLIANGTLTETHGRLPEGGGASPPHILVSGGTGSGKTTLLNVLAGFIPPEQRVITIEDIAELRFYEQHPHVVRLEARPRTSKAKGRSPSGIWSASPCECVRIGSWWGEVRGGEALDMLQAMNTGHEGSMTTVHANSPQEAFSRLETMVMWAEAAQQLSLRAIREQLATIDLVVQMARLPGGERKVVAITEVQGLKGDQLILKDLFLYYQLGVDEMGRAYGYFTPTGVRPRSLARMRRWVDPAEVDRIEAALRVDPLEAACLRTCCGIPPSPRS